MLSEQRRQEIVHLVQQLGRVDVANLSQQFNTSEATIRSDLKKLHLRGFVQRTHGGAVNPELVKIDPSLHQKLKLHADEKTGSVEQRLRLLWMVNRSLSTRELPLNKSPSI